MVAKRGVRIGIDTGGTFTDVVALVEETGELITTKTPSTPADPADGFMSGLTKVLESLPAASTDSADAESAESTDSAHVQIRAISHGTTVATNQLLEDRIERLGFITTEGYEFVLEIARQAVPDGYGNSYFWVKPDRIVPLDLVRTVAGRLDHTGAEIRPLDEEQAAEAARWFRDQGVDTIGVCLLHSYANPDHERRIRDILHAEHPGAVVSISSEVLREYREYERSMTTLVDAAVKPRVAAYVRGIRERLDARGDARPADARSGDARPADDRVPFYIMKSNGGVLSAEEVLNQPITTVLSGPAAGALGAAMIARKAGYDRVLTLDGGGTSTDVSVVLEGEPGLTTEGSIGRYPSKIPMIDIVTVGAGGGSVAWISPEGTLKVGPKSAGAAPGPMCYGNGGVEPTITDAHVLLGRIPPHLLGGEIKLDTDAARGGVSAIGATLGLDAERTATGILEISAWNQANALRQVTVQRGLDVRDFHMATFGGSGSLLLCRLIDILGLAGVIVPRDPGNVSAFGLLTVDVKNDYVQTAVCKHGDLDCTRLAADYADLTERAAEALRAEGFARPDHRYDRTADLRYFGQAYEVRVPVPEGPVDEALAERAVEAFHDAHLRLYGYDFRADPAQQVEWVNLRVSGIGPISRPELRESAAGDGDAERARTGTRPVYFDEAPAGYRETPVYWRADLAPGDALSGPAIIEEFGSTIPVHPGFRADIDALGNAVVVKETGDQHTVSEG